MNKERLLKMADFLETLPPHKFDFADYVHIGSKFPAEALAAPEEHCGTTACAVGWLPAMFPEDFKWSETGNRMSLVEVVPLDSPSFSERAIRVFLDISSDDYDFLFIPSSSTLGPNASAVQVAQQIREFVDVNQA